MYIAEYNENLYLQLIGKLEIGLSDVEVYIDTTISSESFNQLEKLIDIYTGIFSKNEMKKHFDFAISRTHKVLYHHKVDYDRSNSYYHLKLILFSNEIIWLDNLYGGVVSRIIKYFKALFSKIDNIFSNNNVKQKEVYQDLISRAKIEIEKLKNSTSARNEINSEKKRLKDQYLTKIPFKGLFHITHKKNILGILEKGILSHTIAHNFKYCKVDCLFR